jgi:hypothetical protein
VGEAPVWIRLSEPEVHSLCRCQLGPIPSQKLPLGRWLHEGEGWPSKEQEPETVTGSGGGIKE